MAGPGGSVWLLTDAQMDAHGSPGHPERPERRAAAADGVRDAAAAALLEPAVDAADDESITRIHDAEYVALLGSAEARGGGWLDGDTYLVPGSLQAARLAAGATLQAARAAHGGEAEVAFAVVRPPGHHAAALAGSGFCLLNNVAIAVADLRARGVPRVAVVDWDVHHGNGTQELFDADASVFYASTHQAPFYPGTGWPQEAGTGEAAGTKRNRPLDAGSGDEAFVAAWTDELLPALEAFEPGAILVSAGYDAHRDDPLAQLAVTQAGYEAVARALGTVSARLGLHGIALTLEGGYDLDALRAGSSATVRGILAGRSTGPIRA